MGTALVKYKLKIESLSSILIHKVNKIIYGKEKANDIKYIMQGAKLKKDYLRNGIWDFKGVKLPFYRTDDSGGLMYHIYLDSLFVFCKQNDNYDSFLIDKLDKILPEGAYGYKNNDIDVTIKKNDVVIDAGAWIGDFSAYASIKGAKVYAFEPSKKTVEYLKKTQELNKNIQIVEKGLGDRSGVFFLSINSGNSGANQITSESNNSEEIDITTIDEFVSENKLEKVDFIKSDIEGFERYMLIGAKDTLKRFAPKLAICTYHFADDPEILSKIILDANPEYIIVQKRKKLYAMVKK